MKIDNGAVEKDVELEMLMVDGHLEGIVDELEGCNARYRVVHDGKPLAYIISYEEYLKNKQILGLS